MYNTGNRGFAAAVITGGLIGVNGTAAALRPVPPFVPVSPEPQPDGRDRAADLGGFSGDFPRTPPAGQLNQAPLNQGPLNQGPLNQAPLNQAPPTQSPLNGHARPTQPGASMQFGQQHGQQHGQPPLNQQSGGHRQPFPPPAQPLGPQAGQGPVDGIARNSGPLDELNTPSRPAQELGFGDYLGSGPFNSISSSGPIGSPGSISAADPEGTVGLRVVSEPTGLGQSGLGQSGLGQSGLGQPGLGQPGLGQGSLNSARLEPTQLEPAGLDPLSAAPTSTGGRRAAPEPEQSSSLGGYRGVEEIIGSIGQRPVQDGPRGGGRRRRPDNEQASGGLRVVPEMGRQSAPAAEYRPGLTGEMTGTEGYQLVAEMTGTGGYQAVPDVVGSGGYRAEPEPIGTHGGFQVDSGATAPGSLRAVSSFGDTGGRHGAPSYDAPVQDADALAFGANINPGGTSPVNSGPAPRTDALASQQAAGPDQAAMFGTQRQSAGSDGFLAGNVAALAAPAGPLDGSPIGALGADEGSRGTGFYAYGQAAPEVELGATPRRATSGLYKDRSVESSLGTAAVASQQFASDRPEQPTQQRFEPMSAQHQNAGPQSAPNLGARSGGQQPIGQQPGRQQFAGEPVGGHRAPDTGAASTTALDSSALGSLDGTLYFRQA